MFHPLPTSSQLAQHDAWLEEGRKEPSYPVADQSARIRLHDSWLVETPKEPLHWVDKPARIRLHDAWWVEGRKEPSYRVAKSARIRVHRRLLSRVGKWLVSAGLRLQARYRTDVPKARKASPSPSPS